MKMDLIQPFIGSLDTVLAEMMKAPVTIADVTMEEEGYRRKGLAAVVGFKGQIEGRIILDMEPSAAAKIAQYMEGGEVDPAESIVPACATAAVAFTNCGAPALFSLKELTLPLPAFEP